jgi:hypothetical protein
MPGLNLRTFGGVAAYGTQGNTTGNQGSATAAAFGSGYSTPVQSTGSALTPNDAGGMSFWAGIAGLAILVVVRHSLPR